MRLKITSLSLLLAVIIGCAAGVAAQKMPKPRSLKIPTSRCQPNGLTQDEIREILTAHNMVRAELKIEPLVWDCALELTAQKWANKSVTQHDENISFGESIFVASSPDQPIGSVVVRWMTERPNWENRVGTCAPGKVCNHYTQIVWRATRRLGCGINRDATGKWKLFLVCHYDPAGNSGGPAY